MSHGQPPGKRRRYDLTRTFEVLVGKKPNQQRFTVYHDLLTQRSEFFQAARSERWNHDPTKPTILDDVSEEVFSAYLHCVNWGAEYLTSLVQPMLDENDMYQEETGDSSGSDDDNDDNDDSDGDDSKGNVDGVASDTRGANEAYRIHMQSRRPVEEFLVDLYYLFADKLIDPTSANLAIDELISVIEKRNQYLGAPMPDRRSHWERQLGALPERGIPSEFLEDIILEFLAINRSNADGIICEVYCHKNLQPDRYHQDVEKTPLNSAGTATIPKEEESE